jgi:DnaJ-class molecular chaperone
MIFLFFFCFVSKENNMERPRCVKCTICGGTGREYLMGATETCYKCCGTGRDFGTELWGDWCKLCNGRKVIDVHSRSCKTCNGSGWVYQAY